jgi:hypothetical protein
VRGESGGTGWLGGRPFHLALDLGGESHDSPPGRGTGAPA